MGNFFATCDWTAVQRSQLKAGGRICLWTLIWSLLGRSKRRKPVAFGLRQDEVLKELAINTARILGVGDQLASIEKGGVADLIFTDGDPLEAKMNIKQMFIAGREVSLESRHTREYPKWMRRESGGCEFR